jgi:biuret amidohydrolase
MSVVADTVPYRWPYDAALMPHRCALLITGAQQNLFDLCSTPIGPLETLARLVPRLRATGIRTISVSHHRRATDGAPPGRALFATPPAPLSALGPVDLEITASGVDAFTGTALERELFDGGITQLLLAGFASELTVDSTLRSANDRGFECLVLTDAIASIDDQLALRALNSVTMSGGIFGALGTSTQLLESLLSE